MARNEIQTLHPRGSAVGELIHPDAIAGDNPAQHAAAIATVKMLLGAPVNRLRDESEVKRKIRQHALAGGKELFYRWEVKNKRTGKTSTVMGPTIECAQIIARAAGNCGYITTCTLLPDAFLITAYFVDREEGMVHARQFRQRSNQMAAMGDDAERQIDITFQIGQSKAIRNVITRALPEFAEYAVQEAERQLIETVKKDPAKTRARIMENLKDLGVNANRVIAWLGRGMDRWDAKDLVRISAVLVAVREGTQSVADIWPDPQIAGGPPPAPKVTGKGGKNKPADEPPANDGPPDEGEPPAEGEQGSLV
jgi:hypothetical protein